MTAKRKVGPESFSTQYRLVSVRYRRVLIRHRRVSGRHRLVSARHRRASDRHRRVSDRHRRVSVRHRLVSVRHRRVSVRHRVVSVRHRRVSVRHRVVSVRHRRVSVRHHRDIAARHSVRRGVSRRLPRYIVDMALQMAPVRGRNKPACAPLTSLPGPERAVGCDGSHPMTGRYGPSLSSPATDGGTVRPGAMAGQPTRRLRRVQLISW